MVLTAALALEGRAVPGVQEVRRELQAKQAHEVQAAALAPEACKVRPALVAPRALPGWFVRPATPLARSSCVSIRRVASLPGSA